MTSLHKHLSVIVLALAVAAFAHRSLKPALLTPISRARPRPRDTQRCRRRS